VGKGRLEAFSDGVIAIIITIMVLEVKAPQGASLDALRPLIPELLCYALSFAYVGIYWNNHHHTFHAVERVNGPILWANMHLLFWLSLVPFATAWMGENHFAARPVGLYGVVLLLCALAYSLLIRALIAHHGKDSAIARAVGGDFKGNLSLALYAAAIAASCFLPGLSMALYVAVALMWFVPDRRIEAALGLSPRA
jgi:uncharacterized membrane protein